MKIRLTYRKLSILYSIILAWVPLLSIYKSFVPGVSIGELLLLLIGLLSYNMPYKWKLNSALSLLTVFGVYCVISTVFVYLMGDWYETIWLSRLIRMAYYIFCICVFSRKMMISDTLIESMNILSVIVFLGLLFQYFAYYFMGRYVLLYGNVLPIMTEERLLTDYDNIFSYSVFRPSSFFLEPSHIAQYLIIPITYNLFNMKRNNKKCLFFLIIEILMIVLCKSLWGYVILFIIFFVWVMEDFFKKHSPVWFFYVPIVAFSTLFGIINSSFFKDAFSRINISDISGSQSFSGRFGGYEILESLPFFRIIFGSGFSASVDNHPICNSIVLILYGEGIIGLLILVFFGLALGFTVPDNIKRTITIVFFILMFGTNIIFSTSFVLLISYVVYSQRFESDSVKRDQFIDD